MLRKSRSPLGVSKSSQSRRTCARCDGRAGRARSRSSARRTPPPYTCQGIVTGCGVYHAGALTRRPVNHGEGRPSPGVSLPRGLPGRMSPVPEQERTRPRRRGGPASLPWATGSRSGAPASCRRRSGRARSRSGWPSASTPPAAGTTGSGPRSRRTAQGRSRDDPGWNSRDDERRRGSIGNQPRVGPPSRREPHHDRRVRQHEQHHHAIARGLRPGRQPRRRD